MWQSVSCQSYLTNSVFRDRIDCRMKGMAERLREARISKGMTQRELEIEAGLSRGLVCKIENWSRPGTSIRTVCQLADALEIEVRWLVFGE